MGDTPVLIPNTMVKTQAADGTILETVWESRWLPDSHGGIAQLGEHLLASRGSRVRIPLSPLNKQMLVGLFLENRILKK